MDTSDLLKKLPLKSFPPGFINALHKQQSLLESCLMTSSFTMHITNELVKTVKAACASGHISHILNFYCDASVFTFGTFSVSSGTTYNTHLYTTRVTLEDGEERCAAPTSMVINGQTIQRLLSIFSYLGCSGGARNLHATTDVSEQLDEYAKEMKTLRDRLYGLKLNQVQEEWKAALESAAGWSPFLIEECHKDDASPYDAPIGYRFWLFASKKRDLQGELTSLTRVMQTRQTEHTRAIASYLSNASSKNKNGAQQVGDVLIEDADVDMAEIDNGAANSTRYLALKRQWDQSLYDILHSQRFPDTASLTSGSYNVAYLLADYHRAGDYIKLPKACVDTPKQTYVVQDICADFDRLVVGGNSAPQNHVGSAPGAAPPTNQRSSLDPASYKVNVSFLDDLNQTENRRTTGPSLSYKDTHFLPHADFSVTRPHNQAAPGTTPPDDPLHVNNMFGPFGGFATWNSARICKEQRNALMYFMPPAFANKKDELTKQDILNLIGSENLPVDGHVDGDSTFGSLITTLPLAGNLQTDNLATYFTGFPKVDRVRLVLPHLMPWMFPMLPLTSHEQTNPGYQHACLVLRAIEQQSGRIIHNGMQTMTQPLAILQKFHSYLAYASTEPSATLAWAHLSLLAYQSDAQLQYAAKHSGSVISQINVPVEIAAAQAKIAEEKDILYSPLDAQAMDRVIRLAQQILWCRLRNAQTFLQIVCDDEHGGFGTSDYGFVTRIAYEGLQLTEDEVRLNKAFDVNCVTAALDYFVHLNQRNTDLTGKIQTMVGMPKKGNRLHIKRHLTDALRQYHQSAVYLALTNNPYVQSLSPAQRACMSHFWDRTEASRWFTLELEHFGNLSPIQAYFVWEMQNLGADASIYYHVSNSMMLRVMANGAHRRGVPGIGCCNAVGMSGPGAAGKSVMVQAIEQLAISGTVIRTTRSSAASEFIQENGEGAIRVMHEMPPGIKSGDKMNDQLIDIFKSALEGGLLITRAYSTAEYLKKLGKRFSDFYVNLNSGTYVFNFNFGIDEIGDQALATRIAAFNLSYTGNLKAPAGMSILDMAIRERMPDMGYHGLSNARLLQAKCALMAKMQQVGCIPKPLMWGGLSTLGSIFSYIRVRNPKKNVQIRLWNQIINMLSTVCNTRGLLEAEHDGLFGSKKFALDANGKQSNPAPHDLDHMIKEASGRSFIVKSDILHVMPLLREYFDDSSECRILTALAQQVFKKGVTLEKINWWRRLPPGVTAPNIRGRGPNNKRGVMTNAHYAVGAVNGVLPQAPADAAGTTTNDAPTNHPQNQAELLVDYNYIEIPLNATTKEGGYSAIGKMSRDGGTFDVQQVRSELTKAFKGYEVMKACENANIAGPRALGVNPDDLLMFAQDLDRDTQADIRAATRDARERRNRGTEQGERDDEEEEEEEEEAARDPPPLATAAENFPLGDAPRYPAPTNLDEISLPVGYMAKSTQQDTWSVFILDRFLRRYASLDEVLGVKDVSSSKSAPATKFTNKLAATSNLFEAMKHVFESSNLEVYPPEMLEILEEAYPELLEVKAPHPLGSNYAPVTLRELLGLDTFNYLTSFSDTTAVFNHIREELKTHVAGGPKAFSDTTTIPPRWLAEVVFTRCPSRLQYAVDLTGPTRLQAECTKTALAPIDSSNSVTVSEYDSDWISYERFCEQENRDKWAPNNLIMLPIVSRFISLALKWREEKKKEDPPSAPTVNTVCYPYHDVKDMARYIAASQVKVSLEKERLAFKVRGNNVNPAVSVDNLPNPIEASRAIDALTKSLKELCEMDVQTTTSNPDQFGEAGHPSPTANQRKRSRDEPQATTVESTLFDRMSIDESDDDDAPGRQLRALHNAKQRKISEVRPIY